MITKIRQNKIKYLPSYNIPLDDGSTLHIKPTANAWWKREHKVRLLLSSFKDGYKIPEACKRSGINLKQYKYFASKHPKISEIRLFYKSKLSEAARKTLAEAVKDKKFALKYLSKTNPEEFPSPRLLKKIKMIKNHQEKEREGFLEELRLLKIIIGMYKEVADELKPSLGGWYKNRIKEANKAVKTYNKIHKNNNERIKRHQSTELYFPELPPDQKIKTKYYAISPMELAKGYKEYKDNNPDLFSD